MQYKKWFTFFLLVSLFSSAGPAQTKSGRKKADLAAGPPWGSPMTMETGSDNGFLQCAAAVLGPNFRNDNTDQAFQNLSTQPNPSNVAVIDGHGNSGIICTGDGDHCNSFPTVISNFTQGAWNGPAQKIESRFYMVRLLGCDVGADQAGADLLFAMAKVVQRPVIAPTYLVWCGNGQVWLDPKTQWQQATPTMKPNPIPKPTFSFQAKAAYKFKIDSKTTTIPVVNVQVVEFKYLGLKPEAGFQTLDTKAGSELVKLIDFGHPFEPGGVPAAIVTGNLRLNLSWQDKKIEKEFVLYNDEIVQDRERNEVFYRVDSRLGQRLREFRNQ